MSNEEIDELLKKDATVAELEREAEEKEAIIREAYSDLMLLANNAQKIAMKFQPVGSHYTPEAAAYLGFAAEVTARQWAESYKFHMIFQAAKELLPENVQEMIAEQYADDFEKFKQIPTLAKMRARG